MPSAPQHSTPPVVVTAQAKDWPADTAVTPVVNPVTEAGTGTDVADDPGSIWMPTFPERFAPQHSTPPVVVTAQAKDPPADTAVTPLVSPATGTGTVLFVVESLPSWPYELLPQHSTPPPAVIAQAKESPADTAVTPVVSPITGKGVLEQGTEVKTSLHVDTVMKFPS